MKRVICSLLICIVLAFAFASCESTPEGEFIPSVETTSARFQEIGKETIASSTGNDKLEDAIYYVDRYTNIVYVYFIDWDANATRGMMTVLYNSDGEPMTLKEFEKVIK